RHSCGVCYRITDVLPINTIHHRCVTPFIASTATHITFPRCVTLLYFSHVEAYCCIAYSRPIKRTTPQRSRLITTEHRVTCHHGGSSTASSFATAQGMQLCSGLCSVH